jgi:hypothetical protein
MCSSSRLLLLLALLLGVCAGAVAGNDAEASDRAAQVETLQHQLQVVLEPEANRVAVEDRIQFPIEAPRVLDFLLHGGLQPEVREGDASLRLLRRHAGGRNGGLPDEIWRLALEPGVNEVTLTYSGEIHHPVRQRGQGYSRGMSVSPGLIDAEGVFLGGSSLWVPHFAAMPSLSFSLTVQLPEGWRSVSQGRRTERAEVDGRAQETWVETHPQEEVYLIAAPFTEYRQPGPVAEAMVFLREPDPTLAEHYLMLTGRYLAMYEDLIGDYPYAKFALVENVWETGYGMPSFTLLGPRVIRLPFIPYTSYPHEILHNWWGNGVYVDFAAGNWSEGLTSYLADHLLKEQRGAGADYRREALQKYADYVGDHEDFPLSDFRGRHDSVTEAVGYGKTMMVFHMLRQRLGDTAFVEALRRFYSDNRFAVASWSEVAAAFSAVAGESLDPFFTQWVDRPGAPMLRLAGVSVERNGSGYRLQGELQQTQSGQPYPLAVPIAVMLQGQTQAMMRAVPMQDREQAFVFELPARPLHLAVDPAFDLFRRLYREETPPSISQALGAERVLVVLPSAAPKPLLRGYQQLAESWRRGGPAQLEIRRDDEIEALPDDQAIWLFGWRNRFRPALAAALSGHAFALEPGDQGAAQIAGQRMARHASSVVVMARRPEQPDQALGWLATDRIAALPGLARKLPHYGKYSYLGFVGDAPENRLKGQWSAQASPLAVSLADEIEGPLVLPPRSALAELPAPSGGAAVARQ